MKETRIIVVHGSKELVKKIVTNMVQGETGKLLLTQTNPFIDRLRGLKFAKTEYLK